MKLFVIAVFSACFLFGADEVKKEKPVLPDSLKASYWKTRSSMMELQLAWEKARVTNSQIIEEMNKVCAKGGEILNGDSNGEPSCIAPQTPVVLPRKE